MTEIEKQEIEEMAEIIQTKFSRMIQGNFCDRFFQCKDCPHCKEYSESIATALVEAHYRPEAAVRAEAVKEFAEKVNRKAEIECDSDFNISIYNLEALTETIAAEFGVENNND